MIVKQIDISMEPMTSRLPSIIPAYMDGILYRFDDTSLRNRNYEYASNYGMIPMDYKIGSEWYSFYSIQKYYKMFTDRYNLMHNWGYCQKEYGSATAFYDGEYHQLQQYGGFLSELPLGNQREDYVELDDEFISRGGISFWNELIKVIPTYFIDNAYTDAWKRTKLFYPDVVKWIIWFDEMFVKYGNTPLSGCSSTTNCCECSQYASMGGSTMRTSLKNWYNGINANISESRLSDPKVIIPTSLQVSISDLGEMSIFSEEYDKNVDFRGLKNSTNPSANTRVGTVVSVDGKSMKLVQGSGTSFDNTIKAKKIDENGWNEYTGSSAVTDYSEYKASLSGTVSGHTVSRLHTLRNPNVLTDDIGNEIEGLYNVGNNVNHQPQQGDTLEPVYQVGNKANISRYSDTVTDVFAAIPQGGNPFIGDEITSMVFYYRDADGNKVGSTERSAATSALDAINASTAAKASVEWVVMEDDISCDITYYIGETLTRQQNSEQQNYDFVGKQDGVKYVETVRFRKTAVDYYLKQKEETPTATSENDVANHSISYPIYCYELVQDEERIDNSLYSENYSVPRARFYVPLKTTVEAMPNRNNVQVFPVFREDFRIGTHSMQNVDADIYIDRGISAAFEKHLKLGEVSSMDDLINYGNGYFKMMED